MNTSRADDVAVIAGLRHLPALAVTIAVSMAWPPAARRTRRQQVINGLATIGFLPMGLTHTVAGWLAHRAGRGLVVLTGNRQATVVAIRSDQPMWPAYTIVGTALLAVTAGGSLAAAHLRLLGPAAILAVALAAGTTIALVRSVDASIRASERVVARLDERCGPLYTRIVAAARPQQRGNRLVTRVLLPHVHDELAATGIAAVAANPRVADLYVDAGMIRHPHGDPTRPICVLPASLASPTPPSPLPAR
jgi:hypothetical protein